MKCSMTFKKQWMIKRRIDDTEWVLLNIELDMKKYMSNWGIVELDPQRWFTSEQKEEIIKREL